MASNFVDESTYFVDKSVEILSGLVEKIICLFHKRVKIFLKTVIPHCFQEFIGLCHAILVPFKKLNHNKCFQLFAKRSSVFLVSPRGWRIVPFCAPGRGE